MNILAEYKKLTPWQRYEAIVAFSESDKSPCDDKEFEEWAILYHRNRLNPKDHFVCSNKMVCDSQNCDNK